MDCTLGGHCQELGPRLLRVLLHDTCPFLACAEASSSAGGFWYREEGKSKPISVESLHPSARLIYGSLVAVVTLTLFICAIPSLTGIFKIDDSTKLAINEYRKPPTRSAFQDPSLLRELHHAPLVPVY